MSQPFLAGAEHDSILKSGPRRSPPRCFREIVEATKQVATQLNDIQRRVDDLGDLGDRVADLPAIINRRVDQKILID